MLLTDLEVEHAFVKDEMKKVLASLRNLAAGHSSIIADTDVLRLVDLLLFHIDKLIQKRV